MTAEQPDLDAAVEVGAKALCRSIGHKDSWERAGLGFKRLLPCNWCARQTRAVLTAAHEAELIYTKESLHEALDHRMMAGNARLRNELALQRAEVERLRAELAEATSACILHHCAEKPMHDLLTKVTEQRDQAHIELERLADKYGLVEVVPGRYAPLKCECGRHNPCRRCCEPWVSPILQPKDTP